jgi:two-component system, response regulator
MEQLLSYQIAADQSSRAAILLIEDNPDLAELVLIALKRSRVNAGLVVARDGLEALDLLFGDGMFSRDKAFLPRLILLDLNLPKFKGDQVLQLLKADPRTKDIPTVVLTNSDLEIDQIDALSLGADAFVRKPRDGFVSRMAEILETYWPGENGFGNAESV